MEAARLTFDPPEIVLGARGRAPSGPGSNTCILACESEQEATGDPLLHRNASTGIRVVTAQRRINGKTGEPGKFLNSAANLTRSALG